MIPSDLFFKHFLLLPYECRKFLHIFRIERVRQSGTFKSLEISVFASHTAEFKVVCPGVAAFDHLFIERKRVKLSHSVIDIIERIQEDVLFLHPETAALQEFVPAVAAPGHVFFLYLSPDPAPVRRCVFRILEDAMLELVHAHKIRDRLNGIDEMRVAVFVRLVSKEALHIGICEVLHGHGVDLVYLAGG